VQRQGGRPRPVRWQPLRPARTPGRLAGEIPVSVRLPESLLHAVRDEAGRTRRSVSCVIRGLLEHALRSQKFPGIVFLECGFGCQPYVAAAGLPVWKILYLLEQAGSASALRERLPGLSPEALRVAEAYALEYPWEIDAYREMARRSLEGLR
jgi:uncharacterized protein (DUF433 family)